MTTAYLLHRCKRFLMKCRRGVYGFRRIVPGLSERHKLEAMVGPLGFWDALQAYQLNVLVQHGLQSHHSLLDIGCGPLQGGLAFIDYLDCGKYVGIDANAENLASAHILVGKHSLAHKNPAIIHSSCFGKTELDGRTFDYIWASQVLYYFDNIKMRDLMECIAQRLHDSGTFLGDIVGPRHYECRYPGEGYVIHDIQSLADLARQHGLSLVDHGEIEQYHYPSRLSHRSNHLIALRRIAQ